MLAFPTQYEQYLSARRLEALGAGGWIPMSANAASVRTGVAAMTGDPRYLANARTFAQRYRAWSPQEQRRRIVVRIEELILSRSSQPEPP
ncbi:hypothetical protein D3C83_118760 [compost metagenome]